MRNREDMRPAQSRMVQEMVDYPSGIAVACMGSGKTAAAQTAAYDLISYGDIDQVITVAPPRVVGNAWPREPGKWEHLDGKLRVQPLNQPPKRRAKLLQGRDWDVAVVSNSLCDWLWEQVRDWDDLSRILLIIDEISRFKNPTGRNGRKLTSLAYSVGGVWGLTGTPRPNGIEDLFRPVKLVGGKDAWGFRSFDEWRKRNFYPLDYNGYRWEPHEFTKPQLERIAQEWLVYVEGDNLEKPKLNIGDDFTRWLTLTTEQRDHMDRMMDELYTVLSTDDVETIVQAMSQGVASMKLTQLAQGFIYDEEKNSIPLRENPKLDELEEMDKDLEGEPTIIVYGFTDERRQIEERLSHRTFGLLGGGVTGKKADATIEAWMRGGIERLLLHPASAGHGVDGLQEGGRHIVWYHPTWSAEMYDQTIARIDRPGQTKETFSWWLGMKESVDEVKYARVESKLEDEEAFRQILRRL